MIDPKASADSLEDLAEAFIEQWRAGERPSIDAYCRRHPDRAAEIRDFLSAVQLLEEVRPRTEVDRERLAGHRRELVPLVQIGDYRLIREVGRGGMGIVYEAEQVSLHRRVALKILPAASMRTPEQVLRFEREARAAAALHHTNIVPVFGVGEQDGIHYYVMPYIHGRGLDGVLTELRQSAGLVATDVWRNVATWDAAARGSSTPEVPASALERPPEAAVANTEPTPRSSSEPGRAYWHRIARIGLQVAEALDYANAQGVLHRDIKPSNLLLDAQGTVWITDFGLAKAADSDDITATGDVLGTLRYLAPERLSGVSDLRGDIYALGVTLYELLTLRPAFPSLDRSQLAQRILHEDPPSPRRIDPRIPKDLETIVLKAAAKLPADRYPTARQLADDLRLYLENRPIRARRVGFAERAWRWCRRNPLLATLEAAVALLLLTAFVILAAANARIRREAGEKAEALAAKLSALEAQSAALRAQDQALELAHRNEQLAERRFHATQMSLAGVALHDQQAARVLDALNSQQPLPGRPDWRGFEWHYLHHRIHVGLWRSFRQPPGEIWALAFSPDGQTLAVCSGHDRKGGTVRLWSVATGQPLRLLEQGMLVPSSTAFSPGGRLVLAGSSSQHVLVWDAHTGAREQTLKASHVVRSAAWSPDGRYVAAGCEDGNVLVWDAATWQPRGNLRRHGGPVLGLVFSDDGQRLYSSAAWGSEGRMGRAHDLESPDPATIQEFPGRFINDVAPSGSELLTHAWSTVEVIDAHTQEIQQSHWTGPGSISDVCFSPDGRRYATAGRDDRMAILWDRETSERRGWGAHATPVMSVAFDPHQRYWATGSSDGEVKIWHYDFPARAALVLDPPIRHLAAADDLLMLGGPFLAQGRHPRTGSTVPLPPVRHAQCLSADGRCLVAVPQPADGRGDVIEIWERAPKNRKREIRLPETTGLVDRSLAISRTGRWLAAHAQGGPVRVWDLDREPPEQVHAFLPGDCVHLDFSPDETELAAACQFGRVRRWDVESGQPLPELWGYESGIVWCQRVAFSPDGKRLAAGSDVGVVRVFQVASGQLLSTLSGHLGQTLALAWFRDNKTLAVGGAGPIQLWDVEIGQESLGLYHSDGKIVQLCFSTDGTTLVSLSDRGIVRFWDAAAER